MVKKYLSNIGIVLCVATLVACGLGEHEQTTATDQKLESHSAIPIILVGYGPPSSSFSQGLTHIGESIKEKFGNRVEVSYIYNILDHGYSAASAQIELVEEDAITLGYVTMSEGIPALEVAALPFLFSDADTVRVAMDGPLGQAAIESIEANSALKVLGFYENGFRHISNSVRPVHTPEDLTNMKIRVLAIEKPALEMMGAAPIVTPIPLLFDGLASGELEGQENPFENVVTYELYKHQSYYTETAHSYLSRPIFVNKVTFEAWPADLQTEFKLVVKEAINLQRRLHDQAEIDAAQIIRNSGGEIVQLTAEERALFVEAVSSIYEEAKDKYSAELLTLVGL